jgi:hypothetical protein
MVAAYSSGAVISPTASFPCQPNCVRTSDFGDQGVVVCNQQRINTNRHELKVYLLQSGWSEAQLVGELSISITASFILQ